MADYDTYCGIYCGACSILKHGETGHGDGLVACCGSVPKEDIACGGCRSGVVYAGCRVCKLRDCAVEKGVAHCVECPEYPCRAYDKWHSAAKLLPHVRESVANLETIRRDGVDAWLAAQQKRWACPECGASFSWYAAQCTECGRSLAAEAHTLTGIRRLICRWVIPKVYRKGKTSKAPP